MEAIQRKLEAQREQLDTEKQHSRDQSIAKLLADEQTQLMIEYISLKLDALTFSEINAHSAGEISKLIFDPQLKLIEAEFRQLPEGMCSLQEFVVIMLRVLKFSIEVAPQAAIGLREMFSTVAAGRKLIDYPLLFKYVVGQVVSVKDQISNTQFQMRFHENKLQDFLFHDKGIKRVFYSKELRLTICLDRESNQVKFYDREMKLFTRFLASKDKHEGRNPMILEAGYCEIYGRLGLIHDDLTITVMNVKPFLTDSDFYQNSVNEISQRTPKNMRSIYYLEMWGKWLLVAEDDSVYKFDPERQKVEERLEQLHGGLVDFSLTDVLELTALNLVCLVAGNQIYFYNQNLSRRQFVFNHTCNIRTLKYSELQNKFYVAGKENIVTVFERDKLANEFRIKTIELGKYRVNSFQVFPELGILIMTDDNCSVRLFEYHKKLVNQQLSFKHIKKSPQDMLMCRISRYQFCLFETYMVILNVDKVAIESQAETRFSPYYYYNPDRQLFYCSVNNQIVSVHLLRGEVEDAYTEDNSNIGKHLSFFLSDRSHIFEINDHCYLYELYFNEEKLQGENRNYKRKVGVQKLMGSLYDGQHNMVVAWSDVKVLQIRNEGSNNFSIVNSLQFQNGEKIRDVHFNHGLITVFTGAGAVHDFDFYDVSQLESRQFRLQAAQKEDDEPQILQYVRTDVQKAELLLISGGILLICNQGKVHSLRLEQLMPKSKTAYSFGKMRYQEVRNRKKIKSTDVSDEVHDDPSKEKYLEDIVKMLYVLDASGFVICMDLTNLLKCYDVEGRLAVLQKINDSGINGFMKGGQVIESRFEAKLIDISKSVSQEAVRPKSVKVWRPHEKQVVQIVGIHFQQPCLITYANDGAFKLWNSNCECLFILRMPSFSREFWNMSEIEKQKCESNVQKIQKLIRDYYRRLKRTNDGHSVQMLLHKSKHFKRGNEVERPNILQPFTIQIENRQLEDLMNRTQVQFSRRFSLQEKRHKREKDDMSTTAYKPSELSPWKKNPKLIQLIEAVDRKHNDKIPVQLNKLRVSLDVQKSATESPEKERMIRIPFLPQLDQYTPEPKPVEQTIEPPAIDSKDRQEDVRDPVKYLKNKRNPPRINKFDEIDKQFERKRMQQYKNVKKNAVIKVAKKEEVRSERDTRQQVKSELMDQIRAIFEDHNREVLRTRVGRLKEIPRIQIHRRTDDTV